MSREIKFRAWDKIGKHMFPTFTAEEGCADYGFAVDPDHEPDFILEQFIGRKDKTNNEIFEGDIMLTHTGWKTVVCWDEEELCYKGWMAEWEIIGNIHDPDVTVG